MPPLHGIAVGRGNAAAGKDGQAVARILDQVGQVFEVVLDRRSGGTTMRQDARDATVGECVNGIELSLERELVQAMWKVISMGPRLHSSVAQPVAITRAPRVSSSSAQPPAQGLQQPKTRPSTPGAHGKTQVHLHHAQLVLVVMKVTATRANHAHHSRVLLVAL